MSEAAKKLGGYEWIQAADLYQRALNLLDPNRDPSKTARVTELLAKSYFKGAFQAETREEFRRRMQLSEASYEKAAALYEEAHAEPYSKRSKATSLFATFWLKDDPAERRQIIRKCIELSNEVAHTFEIQGDRRRLAEVRKDLLTNLAEAWYLTTERKLMEEQFETAVRIGEDAIREFDRLGEHEALLESLHLTIWFFTWVAEYVLEPPRFRELAKKGGELRRQIAEVSGKIGTPYAVCLANEAAGWIATEFDGDFAKALNLFEAGISAAGGVKDSYLIGRLFWGALYSAFWVGVSGEDLEQKRGAFDRGIEFASSAIKNLEIPFHGAFLERVYAFYPECYTLPAHFLETELGKKREGLRKGIGIARKGMTYDNHTWFKGTYHALSKATYFLATLDVDPEEKAQLLREALVIREQTIRTFDLLATHSWDRGVMRNYLALIKAELSNLERDSELKIELLQGAVSNMQECVDLCGRWISMVWYEASGYMSGLAAFEEWYGDILLQLYRLTAESNTAKRAIKVYEEATAYLGRLEQTGPISALMWKIARAYDALADYKRASDTFRKAAESYRIGAKKIPGLSSAFGELASYMDSWDEIENARIHHNGEQYSLAAEKYGNAANTLQTTKTWNYLSKHYIACSLLERGEALGRQERQDASIESFSAAVKAFQEAKAELENKLRSSVDSQEKREQEDWLKVTEGRERYCLARVELEEAKILDKKGEEGASSVKYRSASEIFRALLVEAHSEQERREMETLVLSCDAWARMKEAEAKASPELYAEAAELFLKAKEVTTKEKFRLLAVANASMCRALESGTRFLLTRDAQLYSSIKKQLETSADYYEKAGFENASDWTRATQRLFDALVYLSSAEVEVEPKKKTELYHLAEKHLELAARLYGEAGFPSRREEALKQLKRAREEKELLLTPIEALAENPAVSGVSVAAVSLTRDQALGLERFETANVVGNLIVPQKELNVRADFTFELEIANVGKTAATLIKLENVVPEGFELDRERNPYRIEDNFIDMKGKRLEYLKTHEVKIALKAIRKGAFELRPRILFADEKGNYRSYEFESVPLTVRELGISGWIKGPSK